MKRYKYEDQDGEYTVTEDEIIGVFWDHWCSLMQKAHREHLISRERCIDDWIVTNWAYEVKE